MVVCKYFLQGTCKFGTYCHYEHQMPNTYTNFSDPPSTSILRQSNFAAQTQNAKPTGKPSANVDINTLVKSVVNDMLSAEKGGQWLLSCYAPFKEKPAFPGFEDQSAEEIRHGFYEAQKNGSLDQYKQQLQSLLQETMMKNKTLQNPSPEIINILQTIYNTPPSSCSGTYGQTTVSSGAQQTGNIFGNQTNTSFVQQNSDNIFKTNTAQSTSTNIFGSNSVFATNQAGVAQPNIFANQPNQNIFGGGNVAQNNTSSNVFGTGTQAANTGNIFASPNPSGSIFGNQQPTNTTPQTGSPFFSPDQNQPQTVFGLNQQQIPQNQNIFAGQNQPQTFQNVQSATNIFSNQSQNQNPNLFSSNQSSTGFVGQSTAQQHTQSIFGTSVTPAVTQVIDQSLYSKLEELSETEKKWFESDNLVDIMNIPDKPPAYVMCFKS